MVVRRRRVTEHMDAPDADPAAQRRALAFIRRVNTLLGYNKATADAARDFGGTTLLDVCCGSADFAAHTDSAYTGLDFHPTTLAVARAWQPAAPLVRGDALALPYGDDAFDVAVCQMSLHHFETADAGRVLAEMDRVSRLGWVAADLLRRRRASAWIWLMTALASREVKDDARVSVRQAFDLEEARELGGALGATVRETFGHRFLLVKRHEARPLWRPGRVGLRTRTAAKAASPQSTSPRRLAP